MSKRILVVDDDPAIRTALRRTLIFEGYEVDVAADGDEALRLMRGQVPDLLLLDLNMPGVDGLEVCRRLRQVAEIPVLMVTARDSPADRVRGLDIGADDYLVKPFDHEELLARLRALFRRGRPAPDIADSRLEFGNLVLDLDAHTVHIDTVSLTLTARQFELLMFFMRNPRRVLSRSQILDTVWSTDPDVSDNIVDVYIGYLRSHLEADGRPRLIHTVRGVGFVLRES